MLLKMGSGGTAEPSRSLTTKRINDTNESEIVVEHLDHLNDKATTKTHNKVGTLGMTSTAKTSLYLFTIRKSLFLFTRLLGLVVVLVHFLVLHILQNGALRRLDHLHRVSLHRRERNRSARIIYSRIDLRTRMRSLRTSTHLTSLTRSFSPYLETNDKRSRSLINLVHYLIKRTR